MNFSHQLDNILTQVEKIEEEMVHAKNNGTEAIVPLFELFFATPYRQLLNICLSYYSDIFNTFRTQSADSSIDDISLLLESETQLKQVGISTLRVLSWLLSNTYPSQWPMDFTNVTWVFLTSQPATPRRQSTSTQASSVEVAPFEEEDNIRWIILLARQSVLHRGLVSILSELETQVQETSEVDSQALTQQSPAQLPSQDQDDDWMDDEVEPRPKKTENSFVPLFVRSSGSGETSPTCHIVVMSFLFNPGASEVGFERYQTILKAIGASMTSLFLSLIHVSQVVSMLPTLSPSGHPPLSTQSRRHRDRPGADEANPRADIFNPINAAVVSARLDNALLTIVRSDQLKTEKTQRIFSGLLLCFFKHTIQAQARKEAFDKSRRRKTRARRDGVSREQDEAEREAQSLRVMTECLVRVCHSPELPHVVQDTLLSIDAFQIFEKKDHPLFLSLLLAMFGPCVGLFRLCKAILMSIKHPSNSFSTNQDTFQVATHIVRSEFGASFFVSQSEAGGIRLADVASLCAFVCLHCINKDARLNGLHTLVGLPVNVTGKLTLLNLKVFDVNVQIRKAILRVLTDLYSEIEWSEDLSSPSEADSDSPLFTPLWLKRVLAIDSDSTQQTCQTETEDFMYRVLFQTHHPHTSPHPLTPSEALSFFKAKDSFSLFQKYVQIHAQQIIQAEMRGPDLSQTFME
ncbi:hypothetical protein BLNAU_842 [Blattamonas nauphoetae]|uniref:Uncharacterized protein n=1 Tax=Blattamonas nauphoetae TaxID=2049346 RepID=A0ABQ9YKX3_9EUKA|nr:hypothetical protein BLNAU_842 [Blattamonas nauphoetae]